VEKTRSDDVSRLERKLDQLVAHLKVPGQSIGSPTSSDTPRLPSYTVRFEEADFHHANRRID